MRTQLRLDYATFNFSEGSMSIKSVSETLAGDYDLMSWKRSGISESAPAYSPLGVRYQENNGFAQRPHKVEISGVGCEKFILTIPALRGAAENHLSRVDYAFDVVMTRDDWKSFLCRCFESSMRSERQRKKFRLSGEGEAMTVYIGSRKSSKFFRIYNKTLEDKHYTYYDDCGHVVPIDPVKECVIRYEIELHHWKSTGKTQVREFDPSPTVDWYYSQSKDDVAKLHDEVKRMWTSFGNEVLLPAGFESMEFVNRCELKQNKNFVQSQEKALEVVREELHDYPRTFEHALQFVVERYGRYIPYIMMDSWYRDQCRMECERVFGFAPDWYFEPSKPAGWDDMEDPEPDVPCPWLETAAEVQLSIDDSDEGRYEKWS